MIGARIASGGRGARKTRLTRGLYLAAVVLALVCAGAWSQEADSRENPIIVVVEDDDAVLIMGEDLETDKLPDIVFRRSSQYLADDEDFLMEWGGPEGARVERSGVFSVADGRLRGRDAPEAGTYSALAAKGGIGAAYMTNIINGPASVAVVTLKIPGRPIVIGASAEFAGGSVNGATTVDWRVVQLRLSDAVGLSAGPGFYFSAPAPFRVGARAPVGVSWYPRGVVEMFLEVAPAFAYWWSDYGSGAGFRIQIMAGARYLFPKGE